MKPLKAGDVVRVVSPSGPPTADRLAPGLDLLRGWGLDVQVAPGVFDAKGYLAGEDDARLAEFNDALADPRVRAVFCSRGGYGCTRIIDGLDYNAAWRDPKPVIGYSDITGIQGALFRHAGVPSLHGPVLTSWATPEDADGPVVRSMHEALFAGKPTILSGVDYEPTRRLTRGSGAATGTLLGGNLSLIVDSIGTRTELDYTGCILLLEDVGEEPYRVDRYLTQLRRAGILSTVAGVALGNFTDCVDKWGVDIVDVLADGLSWLSVPILGGLPVGHGGRQHTVPFGTEATVDPVSGTLTVAPVVG